MGNQQPAPAPVRRASGREAADISAAVSVLARSPASPIRSVRPAATPNGAVYGDVSIPSSPASSCRSTRQGYAGAHRSERAVPPGCQRSQSAASRQPFDLKKDRTRAEVSQRMQRDLSAFAGLIDAAWGRHIGQRYAQQHRAAEALGKHRTLRSCYSTWVSWHLWHVGRRLQEKHKSGGAKALFLWTDRTLRHAYWRKLVVFAAAKKRRSSETWAAELTAVSEQRENEHAAEVSRLREEIEHMMRFQTGAGGGGPAVRRGTSAANALRWTQSSPHATALQEGLAGDPKLLADLDEVLHENGRLERRLVTVEAECTALRADRERLQEQLEAHRSLEVELRMARAELANLRGPAREAQDLRAENGRMKLEQAELRTKQEELYSRLYRRAADITSADASADARARSAHEVAVAAEAAAQLASGKHAQSAPDLVSRALHPIPPPAANSAQTSPLVARNRLPPVASSPSMVGQSAKPVSLPPAPLRRHASGVGECDGTMSAADMVRSVEEKGLGSPRHPRHQG